MNRSGGGRVGLSSRQDIRLRPEGLIGAPVWCDAKWKTKQLQASHLPTSFGVDTAEDGAEEYIAGRTEEITQCMLEENAEDLLESDSLCIRLLESKTSWGSRRQALFSTSPQSTLAEMTSSSWDVPISPGASSNGGMSSGVSSPPTPVEGRSGEEDALDLLYAELLRFKMEDEIKVRQQQLLQFKQQQHYQTFLWKMKQREDAPLGSATFEVGKISPQTHSLMCSSNQASSSASGSYTSCGPGRFRSNLDFKQNRSSKRLNGLGGAGQYLPYDNACSKPSQSWLAVEQGTAHGHTQYGGTHSFNGSQHNKGFSVNGSGMRAVFLGIPGARESGGTGVFLPRRVGHESKRKLACSTVLLPSRIVQALNLNVEDTWACSANLPAPLNLRRGDVPGGRVRGLATAAAALDAGAACSAVQEVAPDVCLPTEWTY